jgi:VanZ family protein
VTRRLYQIVLLITLAICTALFAKEIQHSGIRIEHLDKIAHFGIFFMLAFIMHHAFKWPMWLQLILLASYGVGIEFMQGMLPYRQASLADFIADVIGAISYYTSYIVWRAWQDKKYG